MERLLIECQEIFMNSEVNERIRYLRKMRNLTIKQAAELSITTEKCWSDWENGKSIPRRGSKKIIAAALGVSEELIFENPKKYDFNKMKEMISEKYNDINDVSNKMFQPI
ncbi:helix-turn-helix transcriptional regulator [Clostridium sp. C2-6-12]|uniref:helix-turn-helix transcriptional regulator n=1 Tax=Clostridium sp. C2-6-12 TaxID=2698832 RepID=UPI00136C9F17|nr:helix-turn-helix transcriptional regulator [Clostridium sp. C2-6-12]